MSIDDFRDPSKMRVLPEELWMLSQILGRSLAAAGTRIGLALVSAGFAVTGALLFSTQEGARYGTASLGIAAGAGVWFALSAAVGGVRGR